MYRLALRMLLGDRAKYVMLVGGLTFASLLMTQQCAVFMGLLSWTTSHMRNMRASIWVVDPKVEQINEIKPMRDTDVNRVRTVTGVAFAVPLYTGVIQARVSDGTFKPIEMIGLDATTLVGRPPRIISGRLEDLRLPNTVMIDELAVERLTIRNHKPLAIGDTFEINDREARVIGICRTDRHFFGYPYVYTTYDEALQFAPRTRKMLSIVLAEPAPGWSAEKAARQIEQDTGLYTESEFQKATVKWFFVNTGIPASFGTTILLGFIVGMAVCGQTFYSFVLENLKHLGALKAMGASNGLIARMLLIQALTVGVIGYGLGVGLTALFGMAVLKKGQPPFLLPYQLPLVTFFVILFICAFAAMLGIRKIYKLEPAVVFRGEENNNNGHRLAVQVRNVCKTFGQGDARTQALKGVDFDARMGEMLMVVGPSGCGKTTLLSVIAGTLQFDEGEIEVFNASLHGMKQRDVTEFRKRTVGFIFQQFNLIPTLSLLENVSVPLLINGARRPVAKKKSRALLEQLGLGGRENDSPTLLSGGQQQRVAIARALVHDPKLIICDEPTSALDKDTGAKIMELLREVARSPDRCVIVVTHDNRIFKYGDRMTEMEDGRVCRVHETYGHYEQDGEH